MVNKSVRFIVTGRVQGVFYRATAKKTADALGLLGWIKNRNDGAVEGVVEGNEESIDKFLQWCKEGSGSATVEQLEIEWRSVDGTYKSFEIIHY